MSCLLPETSLDDVTDTHADAEQMHICHVLQYPIGTNFSVPKALMQDGVNATMSNASMNSKFIFCYLSVAVPQIINLKNYLRGDNHM